MTVSELLDQLKAEGRTPTLCDGKLDYAAPWARDLPTATHALTMLYRDELVGLIERSLAEPPTNPDAPTATGPACNSHWYRFTSGRFAPISEPEWAAAGPDFEDWDDVLRRGSLRPIFPLLSTFHLPLAGNWQGKRISDHVRVHGLDRV